MPACGLMQLQVYCVHTEPNYSLPWQRKRQFATTSTGFMINAGGAGVRWLLSNAHSVEYHSQVPASISILLLVAAQPDMAWHATQHCCSSCWPRTLPADTQTRVLPSCFFLAS